jgi:hypothetical protein
MKPRRFLFAEAGDAGAGTAGAGGGGAAAAATATAAPVSFNPDGTFGENWHTALGDEFSPHAATLANFKNVGALAKSYLHMRATGPAFPDENASPEDVSRFRALARVPVEGTPTAYGLAIPEGASDLDKGVFDTIAKVAHANHVSAPGLKAIVDTFTGLQAAEVQKIVDAQTAQAKAAEDALVGEWRGNFEANKSTVRHLAGKLAEQAGVNPETPAFAAMVNNPEFARIILQVSKLTSEDGVRSPSNLGDLRSAQQKADAIMNGTDPVWGLQYTKGDTQQRGAAYVEVSRLLQLAGK